MSTRVWLNDNDVIYLCKYGDETRTPRRFTILSKLKKKGSEEDSCGASSICYNASLYDAGKELSGVLKEFYPADALSLERDSSGQVISSLEYQPDYDKFHTALDEYLKSQETLLEKKDQGENDELSSFIPDFELYVGCDRKGDLIGTGYIWFKSPAFETFETLCRDIHAHPEEEPGHQLVKALRGILSLTQAVCGLHRAGLYHRDIKPENFGYNKLLGKVRYEDVQLIDLDSVCSSSEKRQEYSVISEGYTEPEATAKRRSDYRVSNGTDIYSIGASLFHAIIVPDEPLNEDNVYMPEYFDDLKNLVDNSRLIKASETNSLPRLRGLLTHILEKCLCPRRSRYKKCEDLIADLDQALCLALPSDLAKQYEENRKWIWTTISEGLDRNVGKNSTLSILYHLYRHPLYTFVDEESPSINVLILGFGQYGPKFLDACLQAGQSQKQALNVLVVSDNWTDRELYLTDRPELGSFFNIDGSLPEDCADSYGTVTFKKKQLNLVNSKSVRFMLRDIFKDYFTRTSPDYIFIALGEDKLNTYVAEEACKYIDEKQGRGCVVSYAAESFLPISNSQENMYPVLVNADMEDMSLYPEIRRMAYNTHLLWEKNLNKDPREIQARFQEKYNFDACVSSVLSLKYKLHSLGIDLEGETREDFERAADEFSRTALEGKNKDALNQLIWMEHRRWVTDRLCQGWTQLADFSECPTGDTKDSANKRHVCLVRSEPNQKLAKEYGNLRKWDDASEHDIAKLDELDQVSLRLHQEMKKRARGVSQDLIDGSGTDSIENLVRGDEKAEAAFLEWKTCAKDLWNQAFGKVKLNKDQRKAELYDILRDAFLEQVPKEVKEEVRERMETFDKEFQPVKACTEYRDLKQEDTSIVENIPFILTFTDHICMVIPYATGDNSEAFGNVASATAVNPEKIVYLYLMEQTGDLDSFLESVPGVMEYLRRKNIRASVRFVIGYTEMLAASLEDGETHEKPEIEKRIRQVTGENTYFIPQPSFDMSAEPLVDELSRVIEEEQSGMHVVLEKNSTPLSWMLLGGGFYEGYPSYRFLNRDMKFTSLSRCGMLDYFMKMLATTRKLPYITVDNIMAFSDSLRKGDEQPELFAECTNLWKKYTENRSAWKALCGIRGSVNDDIYVLFDTENYKSFEKESTFTYHVRAGYENRARKILNDLKSGPCPVIEKDSCVRVGTDSDYEVTVIGAAEWKDKYDKIFEKIVPLRTGRNDIHCVVDKQRHSVSVNCEDLKVSDMAIKPASVRGEVTKLLEWLNQKHYIRNLVIKDNGKASFIYASGQIKKVLSKDGNILEAYTYHKAKELGWFDDIECGYQVKWEGRGELEGLESTSEFDCILTKGFRSLFVECKARSNISQDFYFKLDSLTRRFGINATAVLIADTGEPEDSTAESNIMQKNRGNMLDVITISKKSEISNIGQTLCRIMKGTYKC